MEAPTLFKKSTVPSPLTWQRYVREVYRSSAYYDRIKEYCRQAFTISQPIGQSLQNSNISKSDGDNLDKSHFQPEDFKANQSPSEPSIVENNFSKSRGRCRKCFSKLETSKFAALRRQKLKLKNRLHEERKKCGVLRRKWESEFHRANKFEREKRETERKVKKLSDMVVRMREMLVKIEDENLKCRNDLKDAQQKLIEKEEDNEFLDALLRETTKGKEKLEREITKVLKDTADSEFEDLNELHFALLRKTTPCVQVNIAEKYEPIVDKNNDIITLGGGAFGRVFAYRHKRGRHGKVVAMKILHATADDYAVRRQEIILEARLIRLFTGTGVFPRMYGVGNLGNDTAIAMEFLGDDTSYEVMTLNTWTRDPSHHVSVDNAKTVLLDVLSALKALHSMDILHNDIKGDNVIVKQSDHHLFGGYLIDLGNASTTFLPAVYDFGQTERDYYEDEPLSIHYAPELIFDGAATSTASDVYQIGQLIYIMGEDLVDIGLRNIGERCLYREPLSRLKLLEVIELVSQL